MKGIRRNMNFLKVNGLSNLLILAIFAYIMWVGMLTPLYADDYSMSLIFETDNKIEGVKDIVSSQINLYNQWGGRIVAHSIGQAFLLFDRNWFAVCNAFIFVILLRFIYVYSRGQWNPRSLYDVLNLFFIFFFCWVCIPSFGETVIWLIGSVNYLWTMVIVLLFLYPYRMMFEGLRVLKRKYLNAALMFILGSIAGWTNENTACTVLLLVLFALIYFYKLKQYELWMFSGWLGFLTGAMFLLLAPGNRVRAAVFENMEGYSFATNHVIGPAKTLMQVFVLQSPLWLVLTIVIWLLRHECRKQNMSFKAMLISNKRQFLLSFVFIAASVINNAVMFIPPTFPLRATFASSIFLLIGVMSLFRINAVKAKIIALPYQKLWLVVICIILLLSLSDVLQKYIRISHEHAKRIEYIEKSKSAGEHSIKVEPLSIDYTNVWQSHILHVFVRDIGVVPDVWPNNVYAKYYKLDAIIVEDREK